MCRVFRTEATLEDILSTCPNLERLHHLPTLAAEAGLSSLATAVIKKLNHLTHLETAQNLDLPEFQKLFAYAPNLQSLAAGPADTADRSEHGIKPALFLAMIKSRLVRKKMSQIDDNEKRYNKFKYCHFPSVRARPLYLERLELHAVFGGHPLDGDWMGGLLLLLPRLASLRVEGRRISRAREDGDMYFDHGEQRWASIKAAA